MSLTESCTHGRHTPLQLKANAQRRAFHDRIQARVQALAQAQLALPGPVVAAVPEINFVPTYSPMAKRFIEAQRLCKSISGLKPIDVQRVVAEHFRISIDDILSAGRMQKITVPRQIAIYLVKKILPTKSLPEIGRVFGGRDHTTCLHAVRKIAAQVCTDQKLRTELGSLWAKIGAPEC